MQKAFEGFGYRIMLYNEKSNILDQDMFMNIISRNIDGIVTFLEPLDTILPLSIQYQKPVLLLGCSTGIDNLDCIFTDDYKGGQIAAKYLIDSGCKKFVYVCYSIANNNSKIKFDGFCSGLKELGFECGQIIDIDTQTITDGLNSCIQNYIQDFGIFCFNDILALEVLTVLQERSIDNINVVGYDNIKDTIKFPVKLATIGSDKKQMAQVAAEVITFKVNNPQKFDKVFRKQQNVYLV